MAGKKKKLLIKMLCSECKKINYYTYKSKIKADTRLNLKKFCKWCKKHTEHREVKK